MIGHCGKYKILLLILGVWVGFLSSDKAYASWHLPGIPVTLAKTNQVTRSQLQLLVEHKKVKDGVYHVTDMGDKGAYFTGYAPDKIQPTGIVVYLLPVYEPTGSYKGQYHTALGEVKPGEIYTWGEWNWRNDLQQAFVPDIVDASTPDAKNRLTKLDKKKENHYEEVSLVAEVDRRFELLSLFNTEKQNGIKLGAAGFLDVIKPCIAQLNNLSPNPLGKGLSHNVPMVNTRIEPGAQNLGVFSNSSVFSLTFPQVVNCYIKAGDNTHTGIFKNTFTQGGLVNIVGPVRIQECKLRGFNDGAGISEVYCADRASLDFLSIEQIDNSGISNISNTGTGQVVFWDIWMGENITLSNMVFSDSAEVNIGNCNFNQLVTLDHWTFTRPAEINIPFMQGVSLVNLKDISLKNIHWRFDPGYSRAPMKFDLEGWNRDIVNSTMEGGKGSFSEEYDFGGSLNKDEAQEVLLNFIPKRARISRILIVGEDITATPGTTLSAGLEKDAPRLVEPVSAESLNEQAVVYSAVSVPASAHRSLYISVQNGHILTGKIKVVVDFVL